MICMIWAMESIEAHRFNKVIFAVENATLVGATTRPMADIQKKVKP